MLTRGERLLSLLPARSSLRLFLLLATAACNHAAGWRPCGPFPDGGLVVVVHVVRLPVLGKRLAPACRGKKTWKHLEMKASQITATGKKKIEQRGANYGWSSSAYTLRKVPIINKLFTCREGRLRLLVGGPEWAFSRTDIVAATAARASPSTGARGGCLCGPLPGGSLVVVVAIERPPPLVVVLGPA